MRQPPGTRLSRQSPTPSAPRPGRNPALPLAAIGGGVALLVIGWILLLPPFSVLRGGDSWSNAGEGQLVRRQDKDVPKPPNDYQFASPYYLIRPEQELGAPARLSIPLGEGKGGRGLSLWTWNGESWERLAPAEITSDGRLAAGSVDQVPKNVAVMRRTEGGFQIQGILPVRAPLHPDAEKVISIRSPVDYVPAADGAVSGNPSPPLGADTVALIPIIRASSGDEAQAVNQLLASEQARGAHVANIVRLVQTNRLDGIDLEYPALEPTLSGAYASLVAAVATELHRTGQTLTVALPLPKRDGNNWNTFGYDWKEIGRTADYIRILPERDQSVYRRSMREALNFVTDQVEAKKVILTVSPLATEKSEQGLRTLPAVEALSIAAQFNVRDRDRIASGADVVITADNLNRDASGNAGLIWDATAATVSFVYQNGDALRTVWIENIFSTAFKLEFVQLWGLGGVAVDDASQGQAMANIWPAIEQYQRASGQPLLLQPNSNLLRPQWLVDGRSAEVARAEFRWKAAEAGEHTIGLVVGDGVIRVASQSRVTVRPGAPSAPVTATPAPGGPSLTPTPARR